MPLILFQRMVFAEGVRMRAVWLAVLVLGCKTGLNYPSASEPRYGGSPAAARIASARDTLRIVSFNIEFAKEMGRSIRILRATPELRDADVVLLQEMHARSARMAADSLGMHYVYYPAIYNRLARQDFGNAVLSRWPIVADAKLILPSRSRYAGTQRIATAATIRVGQRTVRVYSTHFGTPADLGWEGRVAQMQAILDDAREHPLVVIGGDMNSSDIGRVARAAGYEWPTDTIPSGTTFGRLDHVMLRGFGAVGAGTTAIPPGVSDHRPVWVRAVVK
jgi:endonuclease/exonuclease/phosphatase family metal-dependent hydrolase